MANGKRVKAIYAIVAAEFERTGMSAGAFTPPIAKFPQLSLLLQGQSKPSISSDMVFGGMGRHKHHP